jgi:hypothetical protein
VGASGVAEALEGLAGVHGGIGFGHPRAPGRPVGAGVAEVLLGRGEGSQHGALFALCGEGTGEAQLEQAASGRVLGAGRLTTLAFDTRGNAGASSRLPDAPAGA